MNKKDKSLPAVPADLSTPMPQKIKGLTISEIRYQRALVALQKEFCKEKIVIGVKRIKNYSPFSKGYNAKDDFGGRFGAIAGKIIGGINYLDYAVIGFSLISHIKKIRGFFKKKKK